jgi:hypothetical protein
LLGLYFGNGLHVSVVSAPKLEALSCLFLRVKPYTKFVFGSSVMQVRSSCLPTAWAAVTSVILTAFLSALVHVLMLSPMLNLETAC